MLIWFPYTTTTKYVIINKMLYQYNSLAFSPFCLQYGLYSGFIGCFVYFILGTRKEITIGPTAIMALLTHEYVQSTTPDYAVLLCFLTGCVILLCGILHLGKHHQSEMLSYYKHCGIDNFNYPILNSEYKDYNYNYCNKDYKYKRQMRINYNLLINLKS